MADVTLKEGDRLPKLARQFLLGTDPVDLTLATGVTFSAFNATSGVAVINAVAATILDAVNGEVEFAWPATTLSAGTYFCLFKATFSSSRILSAPNNGVIIVEVLADTQSLYSYTGNPSTRDIDAVRFLAGDMDSTKPAALDAEIEFLITEWNSDYYQAAAAVCDSAAGKAISGADTSKSVGDLSISTQYGAQAAAWQSRAVVLRHLAMHRRPPRPTVSSTAVGDFAFSVGMDRWWNP